MPGRWPFPRLRSGEAWAGWGPPTPGMEGDGTEWVSPFLSLVNGEAPGLIPCTVPGTPGCDRESRAPGEVRMGGRPGAPAYEQRERRSCIEIYGCIRPPVHPARLRPLRAKQWNGRPDPGPGKGARAGGGAETHRDLLQPSLVLQPRLCPPNERSCPFGVPALALCPLAFWRVGTPRGQAG